ncbi:MAG: hypothetical protein QM484_13325 [Woeseiaceae bacterium]
MRKLVSRSEFARMAGITPGGVTKACKKILAPATVGKRIDANHPAAIAYIKNRTGDTTTVNGWNARNELKKQAALEALKNESYADMSLREVVKKHGTDIAFSDWLRAVKLIEDISEKRLKNSQTKSELVSRHLVKNCLVEPFEALHKRLVTDGTKVIVSHVITMSEVDHSVEMCERLIAVQISSYIKQMKCEALKMLNNIC